jgi:DNA modification methylase
MAGTAPRARAVEATTLWNFPAQSSGELRAGDPRFNGCTPAFVAWNLIHRYTHPADLVVDPMAGSGTTLDVARACGRRVLAFDVEPVRDDIIRCDARSLPLEASSVDLHIIDSPYSDNIRYSDSPDDIGHLSARHEEFYEALEAVAVELHRTLRPSGVVGWVISDEYRQGTFTPVGFQLLERLLRRFTLMDIVCLARRGDRTLNPLWEHRARKRNFFLRGFKYLFLLRKEARR